MPLWLAHLDHRPMLLDIQPLRRNTAYRRLFASQFISGLGTMVSYVAVLKYMAEKPMPSTEDLPTDAATAMSRGVQA